MKRLAAVAPEMNLAECSTMKRLAAVAPEMNLAECRTCMSLTSAKSALGFLNFEL